MNSNSHIRSVHWSPEDFQGKDIPSDAREFLTRKGLPTDISFTTFEFGLFDSEGSDLVIGEEYGLPIVVRASGTVEIERDDGIYFFNSSVEQLSECIKVYEQLNIEPEGDGGSRFKKARTEIRLIDSICFDSPKPSVWKIILDDFEAIAP